ncbi:MAG: hypothetical protein JWL59_3325 [Chthoniobacteraceae bacterium]|nr:hypothetical protein [Chthoniobacteraceae bacterium]
MLRQKPAVWKASLLEEIEPALTPVWRQGWGEWVKRCGPRRKSGGHRIFHRGQRTECCRAWSLKGGVRLERRNRRIFDCGQRMVTGMAQRFISGTGRNDCNRRQKCRGRRMRDCNQKPERCTSGLRRHFPVPALFYGKKSGDGAKDCDHGSNERFAGDKTRGNRDIEHFGLARIALFPKESDQGAEGE